MNSSKTGFTLVELSIVLVIIGLLIGGILVAQSLIDSAKVNKFIRDVQQYEIAAKSFKEVYRYWPGDVPNAYDFFGAGCGTNDNHYSTGCNGDGNGGLGGANYREASMFWVQLSYSGMIGNVRYSRVNTQGYASHVAGVHAPGFSFDDIIAWPMQYYQSPPIYQLGYGKQSMYFGPRLVAGNTDRKVIPVAATASIDKKIDDGVPNGGIVLATDEADEVYNCVIGAVWWQTGVTATYNMDEEVGCTVAIRNLNEEQVVVIP
ncbi:MAG: hypothetical protein COV36_01660 [Alphaproteobacteria bacterium CG11_big_fil_rev_8_21_14_0_20_44_7]|nr:MAG: hypothetical protein COV36_01660 [Alphaproteobacteria bacterium CG11_big_fil_rev_8_21_14_0_20_44_7]